MDQNPTFEYVPEDWAWHDQAACGDASERDAHAMVSPPAGGSTGASWEVELIEKYCNQCPVIARCREWAQKEEAFVGIAGGRRWTTEYRRAQTQARMAAERNRVVEAAERAWEKAYG